MELHRINWMYLEISISNICLIPLDWVTNGHIHNMDEKDLLNVFDDLTLMT